MYQQVSIKKAFEAHLKGKEVLCMIKYDDGFFDVETLSSLICEGQTVFLLDVPAVEDQDFKRAVREMEDQGHGAPEEADGTQTDPRAGSACTGRDTTA